MTETPRCTVSGETPTNPNDAPVPTNERRVDGQYANHWTMCPGEIIQAGYKRPVRHWYTHVGPPGPKYPLRDLTEIERHSYPLDKYGYVKFEPYPESEAPKIGRFWTQEQLDKTDKGCGTHTKCPEAVAQTYAANPGYYGSTFCCGCGDYFQVGVKGEFVWQGTNDRVGT